MSLATETRPEQEPGELVTWITFQLPSLKMAPTTRVPCNLLARATRRKLRMQNARLVRTSMQMHLQMLTVELYAADNHRWRMHDGTCVCAEWHRDYPSTAGAEAAATSAIGTYAASQCFCASR